MTAPIGPALFTPPAPAGVSAPRAPRAAAEPAPAALSEAERTVLAREFPAAPGLALRLYGPGRQATTVAPQALGARLDLRG